MNTSFLASIVLGAALFGTALAQETTAPPTASAPSEGPQSPAARFAQSSLDQGTGALLVAPGSVIPVELTKTVDAKKAKTGDEVEGRITQDLKGENFEVVIPKNTKVIGRITEAEARNKEQKESQVGIAFDQVATKNGPDVSLPMTVQAIIAPPNATPDNGYAGSETTGQPVSPSSGGMGGNSNGRSGMGAGAPPPSLGPSTTGGDVSTGTQTGTNPRQPITANTQGVVGLANLKLSAGGTTQGSIISSEKSNVKLESGTLMLLKVNP